VSCVVIVLSRCATVCAAADVATDGRSIACIIKVCRSVCVSLLRLVNSGSGLASQWWSAQSYWNRIPLHSKETGRFMRERTTGRYEALFYSTLLLTGIRRLLVTTCSIDSLADIDSSSVVAKNSWFGRAQLNSICTKPQSSPLSVTLPNLFYQIYIFLCKMR
jgi:hypothetical protein